MPLNEVTFFYELSRSHSPSFDREAATLNGHFENFELLCTVPGSYSTFHSVFVANANATSDREYYFVLNEVRGKCMRRPRRDQCTEEIVDVYYGG